MKSEAKSFLSSRGLAGQILHHEKMLKTATGWPEWAGSVKSAAKNDGKYFEEI